jgi:hypothetical protein
LAKEPFLIHERRLHAKASEEYVRVEFRYGTKTYDWDVPIEYRRTGTHLADKSDAEIEAYVREVYEKCDPSNWKTFKKEQSDFWSSRENAEVTKSFFDVLNYSYEWRSGESDFPNNPNPSRRFQDTKEMGYTIATRTKMWDARTKRNCTHWLLLPLPRGGISGYETWTKALRDRIINLLGSYDAYEGKTVKKDHLLPDHKFPEIRWDGNTRRSDLSVLSDEELKSDFQLINNQRNQQKREACRECYQTGNRGYPFGIAFFYSGSESWDLKIPPRGEDARAGCVGCGWYDLEAWRQALARRLEES